MAHANINQSIASSLEDDNGIVPSSRIHHTRSSTGNLNIISTFMKKVATTPQEGTKPKLSVANLHETIIQQNAIIDTQSVTINTLIEKFNEQNNIIEKLTMDCDALKEEAALLKTKQKNTEFQVNVNASTIAIKDHVTDMLRQEVHRLQQYTRRYSVVVAGIDKPRGENNEQLKKEVAKLIEAVDSTTTMEDVDKFHRNGPAKGSEQETIIRFKSHSAKEVFYRARKSLGENSSLRIRPSLSPHQKNLLHRLQEHLEEYNDLKDRMSNAPEFVFANIHGELQVKFKKETSKGMFITLNSVKDLGLAITNAQREDIDKAIHEDYAAFDSSDDDDDMGFNQFS